MNVAKWIHGHYGVCLAEKDAEFTPQLTWHPRRGLVRMGFNYNSQALIWYNTKAPFVHFFPHHNFQLPTLFFIHKTHPLLPNNECLVFSLSLLDPLFSSSNQKESEEVLRTDHVWIQDLLIWVENEEEKEGERRSAHRFRTIIPLFLWMWKQSILSTNK